MNKRKKANYLLCKKRVGDKLNNTRRSGQMGGCVCSNVII